MFAQAIDWRKLDVATFSWQKVLGGEAQHGMLILSPRAVERLESHTSAWPLPKLFRMTRNGKLMAELFDGLDHQHALDAVPAGLSRRARLGRKRGRRRGHHRALRRQCGVIADWVARTPWVDFLARVPETRSNTSVCLKIVDPDVLALPPEPARAFPRRIAALLDEENVAKDIASYRYAPPGLRIWTGATVERSDLEALMPWLDWGFAEVKQALAMRLERRLPILGVVRLGAGWLRMR